MAARFAKFAHGGGVGVGVGEIGAVAVGVGDGVPLGVGVGVGVNEQLMHCTLVVRHVLWEPQPGVFQ